MKYVLPLLLLLNLLICTPTIYAAQDNEQLSVKKVRRILKDLEGEVVSVERSELPGFYLVGLKLGDEVRPLYLDASGRYMISGHLIDVKARSNLTDIHTRQLNPIDPKTIPVDDALTLGAADANQQIIVFTEPGNPQCSKLHRELKAIVKKRPELSFKIKLTAFENRARSQAQTVVCNKSLGDLELAFAGSSLRENPCPSKAVDENTALARKLGIYTVPALILPDGQLITEIPVMIQTLKNIK